MCSLLVFLKRLVKVPFEARAGRLDARYRHHRALRSIPTLEQGIAALERRWPGAAGEVTDEPIFILAAGWRSGSTLLQRLVMSSHEALVWGEPYANCDYLGSLAKSLRVFTDEYPRNDWFVDQGFQTAGTDLSDQWIANLYPQPADLVAAHRAFFRFLYARPAHERSYPRWGLKEVGLGIEHAAYLKWLFPHGRFLFLYRNPYQAYRSYRIWRNWYYRWPEEPVFTPRRYGELWNTLVSGYVAGSQRLGGMLVKFEDLTSGQINLRDISSYLGLQLNPEVLDQKVSGRRVQPDPVPAAELRILRSRVEPMAARLGYIPE